MSDLRFKPKFSIICRYVKTDFITFSPCETADTLLFCRSSRGWYLDILNIILQSVCRKWWYSTSSASDCKWRTHTHSALILFSLSQYPPLLILKRIRLGLTTYCILQVFSSSSGILVFKMGWQSWLEIYQG